MDKSGYVLNPYSHRYVKIGSRAYNTLIREGLLNASNMSKPNNIVYEAESKEEAKKVRDKIKLKEPDKTLKIVNNKIIKINKKLTNNEYNDKIVSASANVIKRIKEGNINDIDEKNINDYIKKQIYRELVLGDNFMQNNIKNETIGKNKKTNRTQTQTQKKIERKNITDSSNNLFEDDISDYEMSQELSDDNYETHNIKNEKLSKTKGRTKRFKIDYATESDFY